MCPCIQNIIGIMLYLEVKHLHFKQEIIPISNSNMQFYSFVYDMQINLF